MSTNETHRPRLHELLAVEQELKGAADKARNMTMEQFTKAKALFYGQRRTFRPFAVDEARGEQPGERLEAETRLVQTVPEALEQVTAAFQEAVDVSYQIDRANTRAVADLVVDGQVIAQQVPATFLLQLEKRVRSLRDVLEASPTFDPVRLWVLDAGADKRHVFRAEPVTTLRKQRVRKYNVMVEATKEHPAQVDVVEIEDAVGEIRTYEWSGMLSPATKTTLLTRVDNLLRAIKEARSRANNVEIDPEDRVGRALAEFILRPVRVA